MWGKSVDLVPMRAPPCTLTRWVSIDGRRLFYVPRVRVGAFLRSASGPPCSRNPAIGAVVGASFPFLLILYFFLFFFFLEKLGSPKDALPRRRIAFHICPGKSRPSSAVFVPLTN